MFDGLFRKKQIKRLAFDLYTYSVRFGRQPMFYKDLCVPDTLEGRFDMICLHVFLVLRRLKVEGPDQQDLSQAIFDAMFADMDRNYREMGVGDIGVGIRVKKLAKSFYGRIAAYDEGLDGNDLILSAAIRRNIYRAVDPSDEQVSELVNYFKVQAKSIEKQPIKSIIIGQLGFNEYYSRTLG